MSEKNETDLNNQDPSKDRVGDILRKERITRRITVETIAKDLKLNVRYIKSLEASEYESLPADPYVRVYLRSLAKYLSLNPEEILKKFYMERGMSFEKDVSQKLVVKMSDKEEVHNPMLFIAIILIALLAGFSFLAKKQGWISKPNLLVKTGANSQNQTIGLQDTVNDSLLDDSLFSGAPVQPADSLLTQIDSAAAIASLKDSLSKDSLKKEMKVKFDVSGDSVWIQVFSDGQSWKNIVFKNQTRDFTARDSFNIHVANNSLVKFTVNGKPISVRGSGVVAFKIDRTGKPVSWTLSRWNSVFKNRL